MPYIKKEFIDNLLRSTDILDVFARYGDEPKKKGVHFFCKSPFKEENTASCCVKVKTQRYTCYSTGKSGDVITYIMHKHNCSYIEAIEELAKIKGMIVEYEKPENAEKYILKQNQQKELRKYLEALLPKFREELQKLPKDHAAWQDIDKRKYNTEDIADWEIGYAPGNQFIYNLFSQVGNVEAGKKLGLINDKNQDKLWNKLVYPIYDDKNLLCGFATRNLDDNPNYAKWLNPSENDLYHKEKILFALNQAKSAIIKQNRVWIVEGYNDVIAWHKYGLENTVASSGTAISTTQLEMIKKLTSKVTLCFDADSAGKKALLKHLPILISQGLSVEVCQLPENIAKDPDEFSRSQEFTEGELEKTLQPYIINGFQLLLLEKLHGDELDRANGLKELVQIIAKIPDYSLQNIYKDRLVKEGKQKLVVINSLFKEIESATVRKINSSHERYNLPSYITTTIDVLEPIIDKYQLFISDNQIFVENSDETGISNFKAISNFSIEILQHMNDEKFPKKLVRVCNIHGEERIFDVPANTLNAPQRFKDALSDNGNYQWNGNQKELDKLTAYLFDKMGVGRKIDILGWNPEGFYCWNNTVTVPGQPNIPIDKNGIFHYDGHTYYVPSANEIYRVNPYKFAQQKRVNVKSSSVSITEYLDKMKKVHREFGILGMLFAFASAHQDIIVNTAKGFPIFFLYGPPSTGKDELYGCIKKMFGIAKTDFINLENKQSTGKAKLRAFGEFSNMVVHLSEYTNGDKEIDGMMKGLWDRGSYKRATLDSAVSTDSTPILCSAIVTGNQSPTDEAVLTRLIYGEMVKNQFTVEEKKNFEELENITNDGITDYMQKVIWHRPLFEAKFGDKFQLFKKELSRRESFKGAIDRIITNYAILGATHEILKETNDIIFPFTTSEMLTIFDEMVKNLRSKLESASVFTNLWDVFVACIGENPTILLDKHYKIEGDKLYIRYTEVYNAIQKEWFPRFGQSCPSRTTLSDKIKSSNAWIGDTKGTRFGNGINTSAYILDINKIPNKESILFNAGIQLDELEKQINNTPSLFSNSPATPDNSDIEGEKNGGLRF